jgi:integrase
MSKQTKTKIRIFQRGDRWWGDFRAYADVGGKREPLVPKGDTLATRDESEAEILYLQRLGELAGDRTKREVLGDTLGIVRTAKLREFAAHHLRSKAQSGRFTEQWLQETEQRLRTAVEFFGPNRELHEIHVKDVQQYRTWLSQQPVRRGRKDPKPGDPPKRTLGLQSQRHYLNVLSNLFQRAISEAVVPTGHNPCVQMIDKPVAFRREARWLEVHEIALLLESARTYAPKREDIALPFIHPLLATFALTGSRESEILGLEVEDVSFDRKTVTFRPNEWRRLKTSTSRRTVPLWPQLEEILREYIFGGDTPRVSGLLFPSHRPAKKKERQEKGEQMLTDWRKTLDAVAERCGWKPGEVRSKQFRHGYCSARLQCIDNGAPISIFTVAREMGHGGLSLVQRTYGHLGAIRHRGEHPEFRTEHHVGGVKGYAERVKALAV